MNLDEFKSTITRGEQPAPLVPPLRALWHEARGEWQRAHEIVQDETDTPSAWVHAYLHRKEGDLSNAAYWYRRAKRPMPSATLDEEWEILAATFLLGEDDD
ncbi:MAG TPA: hypothetical protein VMP00_09215 [Burkholderiales bacterium]|nr:hypothetical protein [Burkholderiales bacterium]